MAAIETAGLCWPDDGSRRQPWRVKRRRDGAVVLTLCNSRGSWDQEEAESIAAGALAGSLAFGQGDPRGDIAPAMVVAAEEMRDQARDPDWWGPVCEAICAVVERDRITIGWVGRCAAVLRDASGVRHRTVSHTESLIQTSGPIDLLADVSARSLQVLEDGRIDQVRPEIEVWPGLQIGQRLLLGTRLVAARFAAHGNLSLREVLTETHDELRRDPEHAGDDGLVAVVARR